MIFIPGNVPSSKNSKIAVSGKGVFHSKTVKKYLRSLNIQTYSVSKKTVKGYVRDPNIFETFRNEFNEMLVGKETPYLLQLHFVRRTKHKADFGNLQQIIADLLVAHDFIEDDNMDIMFPVPLKIGGCYYSYNKTIPGVFIKIQ